MRSEDFGVLASGAAGFGLLILLIAARWAITADFTSQFLAVFFKLRD